MKLVTAALAALLVSAAAGSSLARDSRVCRFKKAVAVKPDGTVVDETSDGIPSFKVWIEKLADGNEYLRMMNVSRDAGEPSDLLILHEDKQQVRAMESVLFATNTFALEKKTGSAYFVSARINPEDTAMPTIARIWYYQCR